MGPTRFRLGELLVGEGLCSLRDIADALSAQVIEGGRLGTVLIQREVVAIDDVGRCLAQQHGVSDADEAAFKTITPETLAAVPKTIVKKHMVLPLRFEAGELHLAMLDPMRTVADVVSFAVGVPIRPLVTPELRLLYYLEQLYGFEREPRFLRAKKAGAPTNERRRHVEANVAPPPAAEPTQKRQTLPFGLAPEKLRGPNKPVDAIVARLDTAITGAAIAELLVEPVLEETAMSVLFWVRGDAAVACCAHGATISDAELRKLVVSLSDPSLLQWAVEAQGAVRADAGSISIEGAIARKLGGASPGELCVAPVILNERVVNLIVVQARAGRKFQDAALDELQLVCEHAAAAYRRVGEKLKRASVEDP